MIERRNFILVNEYLDWKKGSVSDRSLERIKFFLRHLLVWADDLFFGKPEIMKGDSFQNYLMNVKTQNGLLCQESKKKILNYSREFFRWAKDTHPREFQPVKITWITSLKPNRNIERNIATEARTVSEQEMFTLLEKFQQSTLVDDIVYRRDFTSTVFLYLSGQRAGAYVTTPINAINLEKKRFTNGLMSME